MQRSRKVTLQLGGLLCWSEERGLGFTQQKVGVLYFTPRKALAAEFRSALAEVTECSSRRSGEGYVVSCERASFEFVVRHDVASAHQALHRQFFNLVLLDLREPVPAPRRRCGTDHFERGLAFLDAMDQEPDIERRYGFHRILALVAGEDAPEIDRRIAVLGARGGVAGEQVDEDRDRRGRQAEHNSGFRKFTSPPPRPAPRRQPELWEMDLYDEARLEFESLRASVSISPGDSFRLGNHLLGIGLYRSAIFAMRQVLTLAGQESQSASLTAPPYFNHIRYGLYYHDLIINEAQKYGLDPLFMFSVIRQESLFEGFVRSTAGANGLMQIIPATGEQIANELNWPPLYDSEDLYRSLVSVTFGS